MRFWENAFRVNLSVSDKHLAFLFCQDNNENRERGLKLMETAGENGDVEAMLYIARAYDTGTGLGNER